MTFPSPPVLFLTFNRPSLTFQSFEAIRRARPRRLFIAGDGPRQEHPEDVDAIAQTRAVAELVDWDCDLQVMFRNKNLGCAHAVSSAINWAFEHVDELIILEDDCLPAPSFFPYCSELLEHYRDESRIFVVSGDNFQPGPLRAPYSYYFSRFSHCWGWATWKRAWNYFDLEMRLWPEIREGRWLSDILQDPRAEAYWKGEFEAVYRKKVDTWDYQWLFACWIQSGLTALPAVNLVQNVGFTAGATHTTGDWYCSVRAQDLPFPLSHPPHVLRDDRADRWTQQHVYGYSSTGLWDRLRDRLTSTNPRR